jgi:hypothetical protein
MSSNLFQHLVDHLAHQGVRPQEASFFVRDLAQVLESRSSIDPAAATATLNLLGWNGVTLDYQSLQLAIAWIESKAHLGQG